MLDNLYEAGVKNYVVSFHGNAEERQRKRLRVHDLRKHIRECNPSIRIDVLDINDRTYLSNRGGLVSVNNLAENMYCQNPNNPLTIDYEGNVLLCCNDYLGQVCFGNVATEPLLSIWKNDQFTRTRREIRQGTLSLEICKQCVA